MRVSKTATAVTILGRSLDSVVQHCTSSALAMGMERVRTEYLCGDKNGEPRMVKTAPRNQQRVKTEREYRNCDGQTASIGTGRSLALMSLSSAPRKKF